MKKILLGFTLFIAALLIMLHLNLNTHHKKSDILSIVNTEALADGEDHSGKIEFEIKPGEVYVGYTKEFRRVELNIGGKITFEMRPFCVKTYGISITCRF